MILTVKTNLTIFKILIEKTNLKWLDNSSTSPSTWIIQIHNAHFGDKSMKWIKTQRFGEDVCKLMARWNMESLKNTVLNFVTEKMAVKLDVLCSFMETGLAALCKAAVLS